MYVHGALQAGPGPAVPAPLFRSRPRRSSETSGAEPAQITYDPVNPDTATVGPVLTLLTGPVLPADVAFALVGAVTPAN